MGLMSFGSRARLLRVCTQLGLLVLSCLALTVKADKVWLENGDMLTGEIQRLEAGQLKLATEYAGVITVSWRHVRSVQSDSPLWVSLIGEGEAGRRTLKSDGNGLVIADEDGYERKFSAAWPVAEITREKPALAEEWEIGGRFGLSMDNRTGNKNELRLNFDGVLNIDDQLNKNSFKWDYDVEELSGKKNNDWEVGYSYSRYFTEHWFVQGAADKSYDSDVDLYSRTTVGASLGYRFWDTIDQTFRSSFGLTQLWEKYDSQKDEKNKALTWNLFYRNRITEQLEYFHDSKLFYRMDTSRQWLLDAEQGFRFGVTDNLSLNLTHYLEHDSEPGDESKKTDSQMKMGVGYQW